MVVSGHLLGKTLFYHDVFCNVSLARNLVNHGEVREIFGETKYENKNLLNRPTAFVLKYKTFSTLCIS